MFRLISNHTQPMSQTPGRFLGYDLKMEICCFMRTLHNTIGECLFQLVMLMMLIHYTNRTYITTNLDFLSIFVIRFHQSGKLERNAVLFFSMKVLKKWCKMALFIRPSPSFQTSCPPSEIPSRGKTLGWQIGLTIDTHTHTSCGSSSFSGFRMVPVSCALKNPGGYATFGDEKPCRF